MISIIIPVIRPDKAERCITNIKLKAGIPRADYEIVVDVDTNHIGCPRMVERLVKKAKGDLICFLGDDTIPQKDFLKNALAAMATLPDGWGLVGLADGTGRELPTHWLADKRLLPLIDNFFFWPGYTHCFTDNELMTRAQELGRFVMAQDALVHHDHPLLKGEFPKGDYARVYDFDTYKRDAELFKKRKESKWKHKAFHLAFCVPITDDKLDVEFWLSTMLMEMPKPVELILPSQEVKRSNIDVVRNSIVQQALDNGTITHLFFTDTDQEYIKGGCIDVIPRLLAHNKDICYGVVHRRWPPWDPIAFQDTPEGRIHVTDEDIYSGKLIKINSTGMGCVLIKMEVFEKVKHPWFREHTNKDGKPMGEDVDFVTKAQEAGYEVYMDTSIQVGHIGKMVFNRSTYMAYKANQKILWDSQAKQTAA